ncbi:MAG: undecaprenyl-diphosphate phosphatase [Acutalibacteraceae bacterium]|nr:undecaprenyl-diphosphate phosphatase [Acutalibacteraceae bacterium]
MNVFDAIIQGIVQGLTEFLPVSSSGHLAISQHILGVDEGNLFFNVMLHVGTLLAVIVVYYKLIGRLFVAFAKMVRDIVTGKYRWSKMDEDQNLVVMLVVGLIPLFLLFLPLPFSGGLTARDLAEIWSGNSGYLIVVGISLIITSVLLIIGSCANKLTEKSYKARGIARKRGAGRLHLNVIDAISIGIAQLFAAIFPGISRSGSTLAVGELRGINKQKSLDYAFVLGIPSIIAAALLEGNDAIKAGAVTSDIILPVIVGMIFSAIVGFVAILLFKWMLKKDRMYIFAIYTALVGLIITIISCVELGSGANIFTGQPLIFM